MEEQWILDDDVLLIKSKKESYLQGQTMLKEGTVARIVIENGEESKVTMKVDGALIKVFGRGHEICIIGENNLVGIFGSSSSIILRLNGRGNKVQIEESNTICKVFSGEKVTAQGSGSVEFIPLTSLEEKAPVPMPLPEPRNLSTAGEYVAAIWAVESKNDDPGDDDDNNNGDPSSPKRSRVEDDVDRLLRTYVAPRQWWE